MNSYPGDRTLTAADSGAHVRITATGVVTLPPGLPTGFTATIMNATGFGTVTLATAGTLHLPPGATATIENRQAVTVTHLGGNEWDCSGWLSSHEILPPNTPPEVPGFDLLMFEDFLTDAPEGGFYATYPNMGYYPSPWPDTSGNGTYTPDVVSARGGAARVRMRTEGGTVRVSALAPLLPGATGGQDSAWANGQTYGRYETRLRVKAPAPGFKTAVLLWPDSDVWAEGEINFPEVTFTDSSSTVWAFNHLVGEPETNALAYDTGVTPYDWHTYAVEWTPGLLSFWLDGEMVASQPNSIPTTPMHWVLQFETALVGPAPDPATVAEIEVDYVAQWEYSGGPPTAPFVRHYLRDTTVHPTTNGTNIWDLDTAQGSGHAWLYPDAATTTDWMEAFRFVVPLTAAPDTTDFNVSMHLTDLSAFTEARLRLQRYSAAGALLESGPYSSVITAEGVLSRAVSFAPSGWDDGDLFAVSIEHRRTSGTGNTAIGMRVQDADGYVEPA